MMCIKLSLYKLGMGIVSIVLLMLMIILSACQPTVTDAPATMAVSAMPFETIEQKPKAEMGLPYATREPGIIVIARANEVFQLDDWITAEAKAQLRALDYGKYFALVVFQGWKGTDGFRVQIEQVSRANNEVTIFARFQEPQLDKVKRDMVTSPYHLIQVAKVGFWSCDIVFKVIVDDIVVASTIRSVP